MTTTPQLQPYTFTTGTARLTIRALMLDGAPWFIAKDVCDALGYANPRQAIATHLDDDEKGVTNLDTLGGRQAHAVINESGMYALILRSNKPEAKPFRKWVTGAVLPSIREHGAYVQGAEVLPKAAQVALYAHTRALFGEAVRRHDRETEHDHWHSPAKQAEWSRVSAQKIAKEMGLPFEAVLAATAQGAPAGVERLLKG